MYAFRAPPQTDRKTAIQLTAQPFLNQAPIGPNPGSLLTVQKTHKDRVLALQRMQAKNRASAAQKKRDVFGDVEPSRPPELPTNTACFGYAYFTPQVARKSPGQVVKGDWSEFRQSRTDIVETLSRLCPRATADDARRITEGFMKLAQVIDMMVSHTEFVFNLRRCGSRKAPQSASDLKYSASANLACSQRAARDPGPFLQACLAWLKELENASRKLNAPAANFMALAAAYPEEVASLGLGPSVNQGDPHYFRSSNMAKAPFRPELILGAQMFFYFIQLFSLDSVPGGASSLPWLVDCSKKVFLNAGVRRQLETGGWSGGIGMDCTDVFNRMGLARRFWRKLPTYPIHTWLALVPEVPQAAYDDRLAGQYEMIFEDPDILHYTIKLALPFERVHMPVHLVVDAVVVVFFASWFRGYFMVAPGQEETLQEHSRRMDERNSARPLPGSGEELLQLKIWQIGSGWDKKTRGRPPNLQIPQPAAATTTAAPAAPAAPARSASSSTAMQVDQGDGGGEREVYEELDEPN